MVHPRGGRNVGTIAQIDSTSEEAKAYGTRVTLESGMSGAADDCEPEAVSVISTRLGSELCTEDQSYVLRAYVHRYTKEHVPGWATKAGGGLYPVQFASDAEWLKNTRFRVRKGGRLDERVRVCESAPTWPDNPELRGTVPLMTQNG